MLNIAILGAPGAGKGTQSQKLKSHYSLTHICTGDLLRDLIARRTPEGQQAAACVDAGRLIPDTLMTGILASVLDTSPAQAGGGVIFDGFPRTIPQARALSDMLARRGTQLTLVLGLEVPEHELVARLIHQDKDARLPLIKQRLDQYRRLTLSLSEYYDSLGLYTPVNGTGDPDEIFDDIRRIVDRYL